MSEITSDEEKFARGYRAGVIAAKDGKAESNNPYYHNTAEWRGWLKGFRDTLNANSQTSDC